MYNFFSVGKPEGKRPLGIRLRRWEDNSETDVQEMGYEAVDSTHVGLGGFVAGSCERL